MARVIIGAETGAEHELDLPGLASKTPLHELSPNRVVSTVRDALRKKHAAESVAVAVEIRLTDGRNWEGTCSINGEPRPYRVVPH